MKTVDPQPQTIPTAKAEAVVRCLNLDPEDDWTYKVREVRPGHARIESYDETGTFVGEL